VDQVPLARTLGRRLAARSVLHRASWISAHLDAVEVVPTDLVTISYVLGELTEAAQADLVRRATTAVSDAGHGALGTLGPAAVLLVVEPGTPAGYRRVIAAREIMLAAGLRVVAPCPHQVTCPIVGRDWCHFSVRVNRSGVHRRLKQADLGYEDEKFSYVAAAAGPEIFAAVTRSPEHAGLEATEAGQGSSSGESHSGGATGRVVRRPERRKGLVALRLCTPDGRLADETVSRRQGDRYRAARDLSWGDLWAWDGGC
jgi:ribosomal protein RSM22 (predicted rRNA methylase)